MSVFAQAKRRLSSVWNQGDDEYAEELDGHEAAEEVEERADKYSTSYGAPYSSNSHSSGGGHAGRKLRPVAMPLRAREKNIYTLRPKNQDEAAIAADYMKAGSAVVLNLEAVDRVNAVRIIDFMSGVCYGLDGQGHAMKLGDTIFLFTPAEFEISSDELDYGENREFFFKDVDATTNDTLTASVLNASPGMPPAPMPTSTHSTYQPVERRSWER